MLLEICFVWPAPRVAHTWKEHLSYIMADSKHFEIPKASVRKIMKTNDEVSHISAVSGKDKLCELEVYCLKDPWLHIHIKIVINSASFFGTLI